MERPEGVPAGAEWDPSDNEWVLATRDAQGRRQGLVTWWRPDGTRCCATEYVDDVPHGPFRRFHENGEVSREGTFERGELHGTNVFWRSTGETTEQFPAGLAPTVWSAQMDYDRGRIGEARAYDRAGNRVCEDGSPFPTERPPGVPASAHFRRLERNGPYRWVEGAARDNGDGTIARIGTWRFWTPEGVLAAEEPYADGKRDGVATTYDPDTGARTGVTSWRAGAKHGEEQVFDPTGRVASRTTWVDGKATGPFERDVEPGHYADGRVVRERGAQVDGEPTEVELLDEGDRVVARITRARKPTQQEIGAVLAERPGPEGIAALQAGGNAVVAVLAAALAGEPGEVLRQRVAAFQPPLGEDARHHATLRSKMVASNVVRFGGKPVAVLSALLDGVAAGGDAAELLRQGAASLDDMGESEIAAGLADAAVALDPEEPGHHYTRALVRMSVGDPDGADASIARFEGRMAPLRPLFAAYRRALFDDPGWVTSDPRMPLVERVAPCLERAHRAAGPSLGLLQRAVAQGAVRVTHARNVLLDRFGPRPWLPPDLSALIPAEPVEVGLPRFSGVGLLHEARRDLLRLRWLCWTLGLDGIAVPSSAEPAPSRPSRALAMVVVARGLLLQGEAPDVRPWLEGGDIAPDAQARIAELLEAETPQTTWYGVPLAALGGDEAAAHRDFAFQDELALFRTVLVWWNEPGDRTFFDDPPPRDDGDEDDDEHEAEDEDEDENA